MRLSNLVNFAAATTFGLVSMSGATRADTRIFSVETDRPGVTITAVQRGGQPLPEAGRSAARTFFEIDMGSATVPCSNQLAFVASNGQRLEFIVDLCAHNWQVTLPLGIAEAQPPSLPPGGLTSLTIYTDDSNVGIEEVHLDRTPMTIGFSQANSVSIALPSGGGVKCERDLGLLLTDGRRIARLVNICTRDGAIVVGLDDDTAIPTSPPFVGSPPPVVSAPAPPAGGFQVIDNLAWEFYADSDRGSLVYGLPNSNQTEFHAICSRGSNQVDVAIKRSAPEVRPGVSVPVTFTAGVFAETYSAIGSEFDQLGGLSSPRLTISVDDPIWALLIQKDFLVIQTGSAPAYALSLTGSGAAAKPFIDTCKAQPIAFPPPVTPSLPVTQPGGDYACAEENVLFSQQTDIPSRLIFSNAMSQSVQLFWLDYDGRRRPYMSLTPGESGVQPTFFTHTWVVADSSGRCLEIYDARLNDRNIVIGQ